MQHDGALLAPNRHMQRHTAAGLERQRLLDQLGFRHVMVQQHEGRRRLVIVELRQKRSQHGVQLRVAPMRGEEGAVAVVAPAADEENLDARLPADLVPGHDVGVVQAVGVDHGRPLHVREAADPVAQGGGAFELETLGGGLHLGRQRPLHVTGLATQKLPRLVDQVTVLLLRHAADAGGAAALDLVQQTRAAAVVEHRVLARPQQEHALHGRHRLVHCPHAGERAVIAAFARPAAAVLGDLRKLVILGQHQPRVGFIVTQNDVEAGLEPLDKVCLEQEGLGLRMRGDDLHRRRFVHHAAQALGLPGELRVAINALFEALGLADVERLALFIEHAIDAGRERHGVERLLDDCDAAEGSFHALY